MGAQPWTPICPFFYTKNLFSAQLDFPPSRTAKKAPKPTWACFHCCSSALATVFQLPQPWTPICPFFLRKNLFWAQLDFSPSRTAKKTPKTTRACFHSYSSALATVFQLPQRWTPIYQLFLRKIFFRPSLNCSRQRQPKRPPKPPGLASIAAAVLWRRYLNSTQFAHNCGS